MKHSKLPLQTKHLHTKLTKLQSLWQLWAIRRISFCWSCHSSSLLSSLNHYCVNFVDSFRLSISSAWFLNCHIQIIGENMEQRAIATEVDPGNLKPLGTFVPGRKSKSCSFHRFPLASTNESAVQCSFESKARIMFCPKGTYCDSILFWSWCQLGFVGFRHSRPEDCSRRLGAQGAGTLLKPPTYSL